MPSRIQLRRTKGWRMPPNTVNVARPTKWGNPFRVGQHGSRADCVATYRVMLVTGAYRRQFLHELRGKDLACWCKLDHPCHADVLLELANEPDTSDTPEVGEEWFARARLVRKRPRPRNVDLP